MYVVVLVGSSREYRLGPELEESPPACGGHSDPPVLLSFSHFVAGCCANVFYDCGLFLLSPPRTSPLMADHYLHLLYCPALGWRAKCLFVFFYH